MSWNGDSELGHLIELLSSRAFEDALAEERALKQADIALLKAQGQRLDGEAGNIRVLDRAAATVRAAGQRTIKEAVETLQRIHGRVPPETLQWLRSKLPSCFDRAAEDYLTSRLYGESLVPRLRERLDRVVTALRRDLEIELSPVEFRSRLNAIAVGNLPSAGIEARDVDAFISHASEDKSEVARPLAAALTERGLTVWLDESELLVGRSLYRTIEDGLRRCRFGVVVLSPSFFRKDWPKRELTALAALSDAEGRDKILPVWHNIDSEGVAAASPLLADVYAARTAGGMTLVADAISEAIFRGRH